MSRRSLLLDWRTYPVLLALIAIGIILDRWGWNGGFVIGLALAAGYWLGETAR